MIRGLWPLLAGFGIWSVAFGGLYALQAIGCFAGWDDTLHRLVLGGLWVLTLAALAGLLLIQVNRSSGAFIDRAGIGASVAALAASVIVYAPLTFVSLCI